MLSFRRLAEEDLEMVLRWRVDPHVSRSMLTEVEANIENQRRWFQQIKESRSSEYWIIENGNIPIGVVNLASIDRANRHATWGFYVGEKRHAATAAMVPIYLYNYAFGRQDLDLHKLHGAVVAGNEGIMRLHDVCGYRQVGYYKDHVYRDGKFHDVHLVELLRDSWLARKSVFGRYVARFD